MTLNQAARLLSAAMTVGGMLAFVTTGSLLMAMLVLAAPLPMKWVNASERQTWSLGEVLRGKRDQEHPVAAALDDALRGPLPSRPVRDGAYFVPGVPRLDASRFDAEAPDDLHVHAPRLDPSLLNRQPDAPITSRERSAPVSTPLR